MGRTDDADLPDRLFWPLLGVFFAGGLLASSEALLVPRTQLSLHLGYAQASVVQLVYYAGYLLFAWPATAATVRLGPVRAIAGGLALVAVGCTMLALSQAAPRFVRMLASLLLLSSGVTILQIACNGLVATTGPKPCAARQFTLLQGFNALGTVVGPLASSALLLGAGARIRGQAPFMLLAVAFGLLASLFLAARRSPTLTAAPPTLARLAAVAGSRPTGGGATAIFAYVGAEVTVASLAVAYVTLPTGVHVSAVAAGRLVSLYWGGAMLGRFAGAAMMRRVAADRLLVAAAVGALTLVTVAATVHGVVGAAALLGVGLCNSVIFPITYGLAMPIEAELVPLAAMLLCMAVVGGAVVPMLTGLIADRFSLRPALFVPGLCYLVVLGFAGQVRRAAPR